MNNRLRINIYWLLIAYFRNSSQWALTFAIFWRSIPFFSSIILSESELSYSICFNTWFIVKLKIFFLYVFQSLIIIWKWPLRLLLNYLLIDRLIKIWKSLFSWNRLNNEWIHMFDKFAFTLTLILISGVSKWASSICNSIQFMREIRVDLFAIVLHNTHLIFIINMKQLLFFLSLLNVFEHLHINVSHILSGARLWVIKWI